MMELKIEDIEVLDFILEKISKENTYLSCDDLSQFGEGNPPEFLESEFERIMFILNYFKVCNCVFSKDANCIYSNSKTSYFIKNGGFKNEYAEIEKAKYKDRIELRKNEIDLDLAEKMLKEFPKTKWFARIGLFIAIVLALKELYILLKTQL